MAENQTNPIITHSEDGIWVNPLEELLVGAFTLWRQRVIDTGGGNYDADEATIYLADKFEERLQDIARSGDAITIIIEKEAAQQQINEAHREHFGVETQDGFEFTVHKIDYPFDQLGKDQLGLTVLPGRGEIGLISKRGYLGGFKIPEVSSIRVRSL